MSLISEVKEGLARLDNSPHELKKFGFTLAIAFAVLSAPIFLWGNQPTCALLTSSLAIAFAVFALLFPRALGPVRFLWIGFAFIIGYFMSRIILTVLFFLIISTIRIIMTIIGKDILDKSLNKQEESYWIRRETIDKSPGEYEKMF